ncbi:MAG: glycosyltransferase family 4 protein [Cyclobacteriaceae bacterium]|nr:glycosyltransferase family 4 protein [Cyclobacteriaceae bacterium]
MKLIYIHQYYKTLNEPGPHRSAHLTNYLSRAGWEVHIITAGDYKKQITNDGVYVHYLPVRYDQKMNYYRRSIAFLSFMFLAASKAIALGKADMVYASSTPLSVGVIAVLLKFIRRQKYLFEVRDLWPGVPIEMGILKNLFLIKILQWAEAIICKNAEAVVCLSPEIAQNISQRFKNIQTVVFTNMGDVNFYQKEWYDQKTDDLLPEKRTIISYTGAIGKANHLEFLLDVACLSMQARLPLYFVVAGEGSEKQRLLRLAKDMRLNNLLFTGLLTRSEYAYLLSRSQFVYVSFASFPLLWSGSPNKFFDAMAAGKSVIINFSGWIRKLVEVERIGIYSDPAKPEEFVMRIREVLKSPDMILGMQKNALSLSVQKFSSEVVSKAWVDFIQTLCLQNVKDEARRP